MAGDAVDQSVRVQCYRAFMDTYGEDGKTILSTTRRLNIVQSGQTNAERRREFKKVVSKLRELVSPRLLAGIAYLMVLRLDDLMRSYKWVQRYLRCARQ